MAGMLSKGLKLYYGDSENAVTNEVDLVMETPDIGGTADSVEVTCLKHEAHTYINGILDYGDSLDFILLHEKANFAALNGIKDITKYWKVVIPDDLNGAAGTTVTFTGKASIKLNATSPNEALRDTLSIKPESTITYA